jgi:hypothetical protein
MADIPKLRAPTDQFESLLAAFPPNQTTRLTRHEHVNQNEVLT